jgi:hypothetical protein
MPDLISIHDFPKTTGQWNLTFGARMDHSENSSAMKQGPR